MISFDLPLNLFSVDDDDLEAEPEEDKEGESSEPDQKDEMVKKPRLKDLPDDDIISEPSEDNEPVVDSSYIQEFSDGNKE